MHPWGGIIEGESPGTESHSADRSRRPLLDLPQLFLPKIDLSPHTLSIAELAMLAFSPGTCRVTAPSDDGPGTRPARTPRAIAARERSRRGRREGSRARALRAARPRELSAHATGILAAPLWWEGVLDGTAEADSQGSGSPAEAQVAAWQLAEHCIGTHVRGWAARVQSRTY